MSAAGPCVSCLCSAHERCLAGAPCCCKPKNPQPKTMFMDKVLITPNQGQVRIVIRSFKNTASATLEIENTSQEYDLTFEVTPVHKEEQVASGTLLRGGVRSLKDVEAWPLPAQVSLKPVERYRAQSVTVKWEIIGVGTYEEPGETVRVLDNNMRIFSPLPGRNLLLIGGTGPKDATIAIDLTSGEALLRQKPTEAVATFWKGVQEYAKISLGEGARCSCKCGCKRRLNTYELFQYECSPCDAGMHKGEASE